MLNPITSLWHTVGKAGALNAATKRERSIVILFNRTWFVISLLLTFSALYYASFGMHRSAFLTLLYVLVLAPVHVLMRNGRVNAAKLTAIIAMNVNTVAMAYLLGPHTHIVDFLILTALLPLYLFETHQRNLIFIGGMLGVIPYMIYQGTFQFASDYALPIAEQMNVHNVTMWVMTVSLFALLYVVYNKNKVYEDETNETQKKLNEQKRLYESILEQIPVSIVTFDKQLRYTYMNSASISDPVMREWMIGKSNTDYVKERGLDLRLAEERDKLLLEALSKERRVVGEESFINRMGEISYSIKGVAPLYDIGSGELLCLIGYSLDINDIKRAEIKQREYASELERKNKDLEHFVNVTSHDLKTPLRTIAPYLQLIERKNKGKLDDDSSHLMQSVVESVKHLNRLISGIYQYSVADRNDKPFEITNLNAAVDKVVDRMADEIRSRNAFVKCNDLPTLKLAPAHVDMLFSNLVGNALKYNTAVLPLVSIDCQETEANYIINVKDNGIGINQKYSVQIFEIFKRLHSPVEYEGTGVGLAICKKIVEFYEGRIWVESEVNCGAMFRISLPKSTVGISNRANNWKPRLSMAV